MRKNLSTALAAALVALTPISAHASLKGLTGIKIGDPAIDQTMSREGLDDKLVKNDLNTLLTAAKVPLTKASYPFVSIQISSVASSVGIFSYTIDLRVYEVVQRSDAAKTREAAIIFSDGNLGTSDMDALPVNIRASLDRIIERFIEAYAADNPTAGVIVNAPPPASKAHKGDSD
jgi:hypothetical protein